MTTPRRFARRHSPVIILAALALFATSCGQDRPLEPLRIGTAVWPGYEPLYLARDLGYFEGAPIKLIDYPSQSEQMRAWRSGVIDAATLTLDVVLQLAGQERKPVSILIMGYSNGGDVIIGRPGIVGVNDLKGRAVGVESNALGAFVLTRALEKAGMTLRESRIKIVPLEDPEVVNAYGNGTVDAVVTYEPNRTKLLKKGGRVIFDSSRIPREIVDVLAVSRDRLSTDAATIDVLIKGWFRALEYMKTNPADAAKRMAPREGITPAEFTESLKGLIIPNLAENRQMLCPNEAGKRPIHSVTEKLYRVMVERQLLAPFADFSSEVISLSDDRAVNGVLVP